MNEFEIISPDRDDILVSADIPARYQHQRLKGAHGFYAGSHFGDMVFWNMKGEGFEIWKSLYAIRKAARVIGRADVPVLELSTMYENSFGIDWKDVRKGILPFKQMEMYYAPYIYNTVQFKGGSQCITVDIHYSKILLEDYAANFPLLGSFLEKVERKQPARLFGSEQFLSPQVNELIRRMINYSFIDALAAKYYDTYVHQILIQLLETISGVLPFKQPFSITDIEKAHEAKRLLTNERVNEQGKAYTIASLSRLLATNAYTLKKSFKHVFGISIGQYKKEVFMQYALARLVDDKASLDDVAIELGYSTQQDFGTAFKNYYGYPPGFIRKKGF